MFMPHGCFSSVGQVNREKQVSICALSESQVIKCSITKISLLGGCITCHHEPIRLAYILGQPTDTVQKALASDVATSCALAVFL